MPRNNPFADTAFDMTALTAAINILPNTYGKIERMNLMPVRPVRFRQIAIEEKNGVLNLLPTLPVGAPAPSASAASASSAASPCRTSPTTT